MAVGRRRTWCPDPESGWGKAERGEVSRRGGEAKALRVVRPRAAAVASGERRRVGGLPPIPIQIGGEGSERGGGGEGEWGSWVGFRGWGGGMDKEARLGRCSTGPACWEMAQLGRWLAGPEPSGRGGSPPFFFVSLFFYFISFLFFPYSFLFYFSHLLF